MVLVGFHEAFLFRPLLLHFAPLVRIRHPVDPPLHTPRPSSPSADGCRLLRDAGAVIMGKTNLPLDLSDWESYNDVSGGWARAVARRWHAGDDVGLRMSLARTEQ